MQSQIPRGDALGCAREPLDADLGPHDNTQEQVARECEHAQEGQPELQVLCEHGDQAADVNGGNVERGRQPPREQQADE